MTTGQPDRAVYVVGAQHNRHARQHDVNLILDTSVSLEYLQVQETTWQLVHQRVASSAALQID
jgi:hypothetical protein